MKINEIIDTEFRDNKIKGTHGNKGSIPSAILGKGLHGYVTPDKKSPFEVNKTAVRITGTRWAHNKDAYYMWVKEIAPYAKSNPYLPRIYVANANLDDADEIKPSYNMERLVDGKDADPNVIFALYEKEFGDDFIDVVTKIFPTDPTQVAAIVWRNLIEKIVAGKSTNPQITEVLDLVTSIAQSNAYIEDMHPGNFMIRMTSIGPQLVFTDPLA